MWLRYGEVGSEKDKSVLVTGSVNPHVDKRKRPNYPEVMFYAQLENLRPSTWYHYSITQWGEITRELVSTGGGNIPRGPISTERFYEALVRDVYFKTAPVANEDQVEFLSMGDWSPIVEWCLDCGGEQSDRYDMHDFIAPGNFGETIHFVAYLPIVAAYISSMTKFHYEHPDLWLAPGDLAQTWANDDVFEAYIFGVFNRFNLYWQEDPGVFNGFLSGTPLYGSLGNHNWSGYYWWPDIHSTHGIEYSLGHGTNASEMMYNLYPPERKYERNNLFKYTRSSYSFDYGNIHIVSFSAANDWDCNSPDSACRHSCSTLPTGDEICRYDCSDKVWNDKECFPGDMKDCYVWNDNCGESEQFKWLKRDLYPYKDDPDIWKIVFFHVPLYGSSDEAPGYSPRDKHMNDNVRSKIAWFLERADVDFVITGHDHRYFYLPSGPISRLFMYTDQSSHFWHLTTGTGGYVFYDPFGNSDFPYHIGPVRIFVDGNVMYTVFSDLNTGEDYPHHDEALQNGGEHHECIFVKGVDGTNKSDCFEPGDFPADVCNGRHEGDRVSFETEEGYCSACRCLRPHTAMPDVGWQDLRCIPLPTSKALDTDCDGILDRDDNCSDLPNPQQIDTDFDRHGDPCDNCPLSFNPDQIDTDWDGIGDSCDNCDLAWNPDQEDCDGDGIGDECDDSIDIEGNPLGTSEDSVSFSWSEPGEVLTHNLTIYNLWTNTPLGISDIELYDTSGSFSVDLEPPVPNPCGPTPFEIAPGGFCTIAVGFTVPGTYGTRTAYLTVDTTEPAPYCLPTIQKTIALRGEGYPLYENHVRIFPAIIDFGQVHIGWSDVEYLYITNLEQEAIDCTVDDKSSKPFNVSEVRPCGLIDAGGSCEVVVSFAPKRRGEYESGFWIRCNEPYEENFFVRLRGEGF